MVLMIEASSFAIGISHPGSSHLISSSVYFLPLSDGDKCSFFRSVDIYIEKPN